MTYSSKTYKNTPYKQESTKNLILNLSIPLSAVEKGMADVSAPSSGLILPAVPVTRLNKATASLVSKIIYSIKNE
jgi:hypothetical protein